MTEQSGSTGSNDERALVQALWNFADGLTALTKPKGWHALSAEERRDYDNRQDELG